MQEVQLMVADEVKALGDSLGMLIADIKAGKGLAAIVADVLPGLLSAVGGYADVPADMKSVDNQIYLARILAMALEPKA